MQPQIIAPQVAASSGHFSYLNSFYVFQLYPRSDSGSIAFLAAQLHNDSVICGRCPVEQDVGPIVQRN
jgi:hypothetical protein